MIKVIRFADEGFKNYIQDIELENGLTSVNGCFAFVKKSHKKALTYPKSQLKKDDGGIVRINHRKNELQVSEDTMIYARRFNTDDVYVVKNSSEISIQPEFLWSNWDKFFRYISISEVYKEIIRYENLIKGLKKEAKDNNLRFVNFNQEYLLYEMLITV